MIRRAALIVRCDQCGKSSLCERFTDDSGRVVDTYGYMEFADENVCHVCLGETYVGPILTIGGDD